MKTLMLDSDARGVVRLTLNRPQVHNAFDETMIAELHETFDALGRQAGVRAIVLTGAGASFSAGADVTWMRRAADMDEAANRADALRMADMFACLDACPKPVIGLVNGAVFGGGVGLLACCDIVIAHPRAVFGLTEVRLGLIPAVIAPFVIAKTGAAAARRYMLTAERFDAATARRIGLVQEIKQRPDLSTSTIMMLTSGGQRGDAARCGELGISAYLVKPVRQAELREAISRVLAQKDHIGAAPMITERILQDHPDPRKTLHILLAEDNLVNQKLATRLLEKRGHRVVLAINGKRALSALEKTAYDLVLAAQDAGIAALRPGARFRDFHRAAMRVIAEGLHDWGVLRISPEQATDPDSGLYRRWTLCSSGHMLGMDVHDCAAARADAYLDGVLVEGQVLTVEPGLYLQPDDELLPAELRGMGIRIEDDLVITADGAQLMSGALPRTADGVEEWMGGLLTR